jgi:hypothetical protein
MSTRTLRFFTHSAAALLLATASALFLINLTGPVHLVQPHDPIFAISLRYMFWIIGGIAVLVALFCLFSERPAQPTAWVAWLAANFLLYRIGLYCDGCHDLTGFLGSFSYAFGIPAKTANTLANLVFAYLLIGSCAALLWQWRHSSKNPSIHQSTTPLLRMSCPGCGVHIEFATGDLGQKIPCPHCRATVTLRKPDLLKAVCFFCKGHIEFPPHAIGEKIHCPHCKMDITLKEPA